LGVNLFIFNNLNLKLKIMAKIMQIKSQLTKAGKPVVIVTTAEKTHFVPWGQWLQVATKDLQAYNGGEFTGFYFRKGEILLNGASCTADDTILNTFTATQNARVAAHVAIITNEQEADRMNEAMFAQRALRNTRTKTDVPVTPIPVG
jgi:hypothetical protein